MKITNKMGLMCHLRGGEDIEKEIRSMAFRWGV